MRTYADCSTSSTVRTETPPTRRRHLATSSGWHSAGAVMIGSARATPTPYDRSNERPRISYPFRLFSRNCRAFRYDCFPIFNSTSLSTIPRSIDVQSICFANPSRRSLLSFTINRPGLRRSFFFLPPLLALFFYIAYAMQYAVAYDALLIIAIGTVPDSV